MPFAKWRQGLQRKLSRRSAGLQLNHRNLYILPSRFGGLWLLTAGVLYLLGINSRSNGPVLLAFVMGAVLLLSLFLTHLNLQGLSLQALPQRPCLAGEPTTYRLETHSRCHRPSLKWRWLQADAPAAVPPPGAWASQVQSDLASPRARAALTGPIAVAHHRATGLVSLLVLLGTAHPDLGSSRTPAWPGGGALAQPHERWRSLGRSSPVAPGRRLAPPGLESPSPGPRLARQKL